MHHNVPWKKLMCNNYATRRWCIILNLVIKGRLSTKMKLDRWGINVDQTCTLCRYKEKTIIHMFIDCDFSNKVLQRLLLWQGINRSVVLWEERLSGQVKKWKGNIQLLKFSRWKWLKLWIILGKKETLDSSGESKRNVVAIFRSLVEDLFVNGSRQCKLRSRLQFEFLSLVAVVSRPQNSNHS